MSTVNFGAVTIRTTFGLLIAVLWAMVVAGCYSEVNSPLDYDAVVDSDWAHASLYGERALDLRSSGTSVYSNLHNPHSTDYLYYEVYDYKASAEDCPGTKFYIYDHTPGDYYYYYGRINYVHLGDHSGLWGRWWNISPGQSENWLYVGYTIASCGAPVHLHFGHSAYDGMTEAYTGGQNGTLYRQQVAMYH